MPPLGSILIALSPSLAILSMVLGLVARARWQLFIGALVIVGIEEWLLSTMQLTWTFNPAIVALGLVASLAWAWLGFYIKGERRRRRQAMSSVVSGFQNQVWRVISYSGPQETGEERIPFEKANEQDIVNVLQSKVAADLTEREVKESPHLLEVRKDDSGGARIMYMAGEDPHYVASLWRADELPALD